jgi:hypothetical protein
VCMRSLGVLADSLFFRDQLKKHFFFGKVKVV